MVWPKPCSSSSPGLWLTDPFGLHLGNTLGVLKGSSTWAQLSDFFRYPILGGHPTYGVAALHAILVVFVAAVLGTSLRGFWFRRREWRSQLIGQSPTAFAQNGVIFAYGSLLTASTLMIRRYYLLITFPLKLSGYRGNFF